MELINSKIGDSNIHNDKIHSLFDNWKKRSEKDIIKAICKPCWELNYCPYGSLVEIFEISYDEIIGCRIYGHICPAFRVAEPLTESIKIRNISRNIKQSVKLKVFSRDNRACPICGRFISFDDVHFDHVIPWSLGGSSDENNIRILCNTCNQKRSNNFHDEYLVNNAFDDPSRNVELSCNEIEDLLRLFLLLIIMKSSSSEFSSTKFCNIIHEKDDNDGIDTFLLSIVSNIYDILYSDIPFIKTKKKMNILRYRWGIKDKRIHTIKDVCLKYQCTSKYYIEIEERLFRQIGFTINNEDKNSEKYSCLTANLDGYVDNIDNIV